MATILLIIIYMAFVGLGIPDSIFGAAWPVIYTELGIAMSMANVFTFLMSVLTFVTSFFSARAINKFGTGVITTFSTVLTAGAILGFAFSNNFWFMCLLSIPFGVGAGCIDSALNNYVALHYKAVHMNFLHSAYGIGVSVSPFLMSFALSDNNNWRKGYIYAFVLMLFILLATVLALPMWKKVKHIDEEKFEPVTPITLTYPQMIKMKDVRALWLIFMCSVGIEFVCGAWGSTFLVNTHKFNPDLAAEMITFYYVGITLGRLLSGFLATKLRSWTIIYIGVTLVGIALTAILLAPNGYVAAAGLFFVGLGNGPVFPNLTYLTPISFGRDISQSIISANQAASSVGLLVAPFIFGFLAQNLSTDILPIFQLTLYVMLIVSIIKLTTMFKKENRY